MNTLTISVYSNDLLDAKFDNINYQEKETFIYFENDNTKYFLYKDLNTFKYHTKEEKVNMNFKEKLVTITLLQNGYIFDIKINKFTHEKTKNTYKITYVLDSEPDITKTILITL